MTAQPRVNKLRAAMQGMQSTGETASTAEVVRLPETTNRYPVAPSRIGKRMVSAYFAPEAIKQLHLLSVERDATIQDLVAEALNDLFRKHGKSAIA
jgi:hypothetical protein